MPPDCAGLIGATTDGGRTWHRQYAGAEAIGPVQFASTTTGWAVRWHGTSCVAADGGHSWWDTTLPLQARNVDLSHHTATDGWVAASLSAPGQPALMASHDNGRTWQRLPDPGSSFEQRVYFRDASHGWLLAGGEPGAGAQMKELFGTTDGGHTWTKLAATGGFGAPGSTGTGGLPGGGYVG